MFFQSLLFLQLFLPVTLFFYYISRENYRKPILLCASLIFVAWFNVSLTVVIIGSILFNYLAGIAIGKAVNERKRTTLFSFALAINIAMLFVFKYFGFLGENVSELISIFGIKPFIITHFALPVGISFYTFKAISYLISVKRHETPPQRSFANLALYISLFPQLVAGPIDRYKNLAPQLSKPSPSIDLFSSGVGLFVKGLAKKVLIASTFAIQADTIFNAPVDQLNSPLAWLGAVFYTLQIYYDFSGYTDMAIGIGKMLGLQFAINFNLPYTARTVGDFWKRWHITLSTWLRDYLFLPLAYNRSKKMKKERYLNIRTDQWIYLYATLITFILCGLWHGAEWTFILWGLAHGLILVVEQFGLRKFLKRSYKPVQHFYLLIFIVLTWVLFRSPSIRDAFLYIGAMFGASGQSENFSLAAEYLDIRTLIMLSIGIPGAFGFFSSVKSVVQAWLGLQNSGIASFGFHSWQIFRILTMMLVLILSIMFIVAETNMPFIYFKF